MPFGRRRHENIAFIPQMGYPLGHVFGKIVIMELEPDSSSKKTVPSALQLADAQLLDEIYKTAMMPNRYDALMHSWGARIEAAVFDLASSDAAKLNAATIDASVSYLNTSMAVLKAFDALHGRFYPDDDGAARARLLLNAAGRIVWFNGHAQAGLGLSRNSKLAQLALDADSNTKLKAMLLRLNLPGLSVPAPIVLRVMAQPDDPPRYLIAQQMTQPDDEKLLLLEDIDAGWTPMLANILRSSFSLSTRELQIAEALAAGQTLAEVSDMTGRQVSTLRTQLKSILRKTATNSQAQLVRLVLSIAAHLERKTPVGTPAGDYVSQHVLPDGRAMPYHVFGPATGRPVLYIHGMLDGLLQFATLGPALKKANLRIIAPERPGFGSAQTDASPIKDRPSRFCADICNLLNALGIARLPVVGHMTGSVYTFAIAAQASQRISAIYNVAGAVPIRDLAQVRQMSKRQRTVAFTARFFPSALPLILLAGIRQIKAGGISNFIHAHYENSPVDINAFSDPQIASVMTDGVQFGIAQGYHAVEADINQVVQNWSELISASTCPVTLLHGRHDKVVIAESVVALAQDLGERCRLILSETAGQTLFYTQPDLVIAALADSLD